MRAEPVMTTLNGAASLNLASTSAGAATGSACISCSGRSMVGPPRRAVGGGPCWGEGGGGALRSPPSPGGAPASPTAAQATRRQITCGLATKNVGPGSLRHTLEGCSSENLVTLPVPRNV